MKNPNDWMCVSLPNIEDKKPQSAYLDKDPQQWDSDSMWRAAVEKGLSILQDVRANLERNALKHCIDQLTPQLQDPQCKPWLVIGVKFTTEFSGMDAWITQHLYPTLCDTEGIAESIISPYENGYVMKVSEVRKKFNIKIKK